MLSNKRLTSRIINLMTGGTETFPIVGLPPRQDCLETAINFQLHIHRPQLVGSEYVELKYDLILSLIKRVLIEAFGEKLVKDLHFYDQLVLSMLEGASIQFPWGNTDGASTPSPDDVSPAWNPAMVNVPPSGWDIYETFSLVIPWYDTRQDEEGRALDSAQDTQLLLQSGKCEIEVKPILDPAGNDIDDAEIVFEPSFKCQVRKGIYARPFKVYRKVPVPTLNGAIMDRGGFMDILARNLPPRGQEGAITVMQNVDATVYAEYGGIPFVDRQRVRFHNAFLTSHSSLLTSPMFLPSWYATQLVGVHRQQYEISELSKMRISPDREGILEVAPGSIVPFDQGAGEIMYTEMKPVDKEHSARVRMTYAIPPSAIVYPEGPDANYWTPIKMA